ncbi:MAG: hypothetical protein KA831_07345, partial [Pyrinomonadaceae bacterium]|nr:hypothetical protein [Pyrinomonadaceae bacterium]
MQRSRQERYMPSQIRSFRSFRTAVMVFALASIISLCGTMSTFAQKPKPAPKSAATKPVTTPKSSAAATGKCPGSILTTDEVNQALAVHN